MNLSISKYEFVTENGEIVELIIDHDESTNLPFAIKLGGDDGWQIWLSMDDRESLIAELESLEQ